MLAICAMPCNSLLPTIVFAHAAANPFILLAEFCTSSDTKLECQFRVRTSMQYDEIRAVAWYCHLFRKQGPEL